MTASSSIFILIPEEGLDLLDCKDPGVRVSGYKNAVAVAHWMGYKKFTIYPERANITICKSRAFESISELLKTGSSIDS